MSIQEPMTVMGIPGKIEILRPEDKLVVRVPNLDQKMANEIDASFTERLGKHRAVVLPDLAVAWPIQAASVVGFAVLFTGIAELVRGES